MKIQKGFTYILNAEEQDHLENARGICNFLIEQTNNYKNIINPEFTVALKMALVGLNEILDCDEGEFSIESEGL